MMIRVGVGVLDPKQEAMLIHKLNGLSFVMNVEFDTARYSQDFDALSRNMEKLDLILLSLDFLALHEARIHELYRNNPRCLPILLAEQRNNFADYLAVRPIEYIETIKSIDSEDPNSKLRKICDLFIELVNRDLNNKTDNRVLHITTRKGSYAIPKESILYCQSDLKYTIFVLDNGTLIRKLEKLQDVMNKYLWDFQRVHQSYLVNPARIETIDRTANEIILSGGIRIPFSRRYASDVHTMFSY